MLYDKILFLLSSSVIQMSHRYKEIHQDCFYGPEKTLALHVGIVLPSNTASEHRFSLFL